MPLLIRAMPRDGHELDDHLGAVLALYERGLEINILLHAQLGPTPAQRWPAVVTGVRW